MTKIENVRIITKSFSPLNTESNSRRKIETYVMNWNELAYMLRQSTHRDVVC